MDWFGSIDACDGRKSGMEPEAVELPPYPLSIFVIALRSECAIACITRGHGEEDASEVSGLRRPTPTSTYYASLVRSDLVPHQKVSEAEI